LEEILTQNFLDIEVGLKLFFIYTLEIVVGSVESIVVYLHIKVAVWAPFKSSTCTLKLLLVAPLEE